MKKETIASITTPIGEGGIGVIQVSGPESLKIVNSVFKGKKLKDMRNADSKMLYYGDIHSNGSPVDEVIVNVLRKQDSDTGEDMVEINCHGGILAVKKTLESVVSAGAKEVYWDELARRPYINKKIDRIQEEALLEIPGAKTKLGVKVLLDQYNGALSSVLHEIVKQIETGNSNCNREILNIINNTLRKILATAGFGRAIISPRKLIFVGKPNVGKSTLMNALLQEDRVITHEEPGTTRDAIEEMVSIDGIPFTIIDTAGIRNTDHEVEKLGVLESKKQMRQADKIIIVFDNSKPVEKEDRELIEFIDTLDLHKTDKPDDEISIIPVLNKTDLPGKLKLETVVGKKFEPICRVSALNGDGLSALEATLIFEFKEFTQYTPERPIIFTKRQQVYLAKALNISTQYIQTQENSSDYPGLLHDIKQNLLNCIDDSH